MPKRLFEILDEMNQNDDKNKTATCGVNPTLVSAQKARGGGHVTMGVPENVLMDLVVNPGKHLVFLMVVDKKEYDRIATQSTPSSTTPTTLPA